VVDGPEQEAVKTARAFGLIFMLVALIASARLLAGTFDFWTIVIAVAAWAAGAALLMTKGK
jgi:hypothetical protein